MKDEALVVNLEPHDFQAVGAAESVPGSGFLGPKLKSQLFEEFRQAILASVLVVKGQRVQLADHLVCESGWVFSKGVPEQLEAVEIQDSVMVGEGQEQRVA